MPINNSIKLRVALGTSLAVADMVVGFGMISMAVALTAPIAAKILAEPEKILPNATKALITQTVTDKLPDLLVERLRNEGQGLEAAFLSAFEEAITNVEDRWSEGGQAKYLKANRRESYDNCKGVFGVLKDSARSMRRDGQHRGANVRAEIFTLLRDETETPEGLFSLNLDKLIAERDEQFQRLIKSNLLPECKKCFSQLLDSKSEDGVRANNLYVRLMLGSVEDRFKEMNTLWKQQAISLNNIDNKHDIILANDDDIRSILQDFHLTIEQNNDRVQDAVRMALSESIASFQSKTDEGYQRYFDYSITLLEEIRDAVVQRTSVPTNTDDAGVAPVIDPSNAAIHQGGLLALQARSAYAPFWPPEAGLPVDLGTAWGLYRGTSVNILLSGDEHQLVQHMARVERELQPRMQDSFSDLYLLPRLWYEIDITTGAPVPNSTADFWKLISITEANQRERERRWIDAGQVNPGLVLNVRFNSEAQIDVDWVSAHLAAWSAALLRDLFGESQLSLIIRLPSAPLLPVLSVSSRLTERLSAVDVGLAYDPMTLIEYTREEPVAATRDVMDFFNFKEGTESSDAILSWIHEAYPAMLQSPRADLERFNKLRTTFRELVSSGNAERSTLRPASAVAQELANLTPDVIGNFLEFVHHYLPGRLAELIAALAADGGQAVTMVGLRFAIGRIDLVDAWVTGVTRRADGATQAVEGVKTIGGTVLAEALAFGFLRKSTLEGRSTEFQDSLRQLHAAVTGPTLNVISYYTSSKTHPSLLDFEALEKAARAELLPDTVIEMLLDSDLDAPLPWWILLALPPTETLLNHLLRHSGKKRAVFGLCSAEETAAVVGDSLLRSEIDAGRNRTGPARVAVQGKVKARMLN